MSVRTNSTGSPFLGGFESLGSLLRLFARFEVSRALRSASKYGVGPPAPAQKST